MSNLILKSGVDELIKSYQEELSSQNQTLHISDVTDAQGHQYVDLVQEGGGVLGIALVGYTYVMEKMGIRFFSMAGTSAGAINTLLLACMGNKESEKSEKITTELSQLNMFDFVDGKPDNSRFTKWAKKWVQKIILKPKSLSRFIGWLKLLFIALFVTTIACFIINFFAPGISKWIGLAAIVFLLILTGIVFLIAKRIQRISKSGYGLSKGHTFHDWLKGILEGCFVQQDPLKGSINSLAAFGEHFMQVPPLIVRSDERRPQNLPPHMPMITLITCDIISKIKIEFPRMWDLYWSKPEHVHSADFVRASMSIPVFFESYQLTELRKKSNFEIWSKQVNWQNALQQIPNTGQFIDGGILSNFPISIFYNPHYPVPRMPTFGVRLQDGIIDAANRSNNSLSKYIMSLFSTIRFHFDRDFITRNRAFNKAVCSIDVQGHSWLNFFMDDAEKVKLFREGAESAIHFLRNFDWELYKSERAANAALAVEQFDNPNNLQTFPFSTAHPGQMKE